MESGTVRVFGTGAVDTSSREKKKRGRNPNEVCPST
jgi:hypothetical protein